MALTPNQRRFAESYVALGGGHGAGAEAARQAGYAPTRADREAYELLRHPGVLEHIRVLVQSKLQASIAFAAAELQDIAADRDNSKDRAVQLKAVQALLDRGGLLLSKVSELHVFDHTPRDEIPMGSRLAAVIVRMMPKLGLAVVDQARFDRYIQGLNASEQQPLLIDVTPEDEWHA